MSKQPAPERVRVSGPLARFADGFRVDLIERGYSLWRAQEQLFLLAHMSRWMEAERLELAGLTPATLERYFTWRRRQGYRKSLSPLSLRRPLGYLDGLGVLPTDEVVPSPVDGLLAEFRRYLLQERGVAAKTVELYEPVARLFLSGRSEPLADDLARLSGAEVSTFVLREARRRSARSAEMMASALRALLRFLYAHGMIAAPLAAAVPSVACRREDLPRGIASGQVRLLLDSCDRSRPVGRRDYAIVGFIYTRALAAFARRGAGAQARALLAEARERNPHIPAYLTGRKRLPRERPAYTVFGEESEAVDYAAGAGELWGSVPGALAWLES